MNQTEPDATPSRKTCLRAFETHPEYSNHSTTATATCRWMGILTQTALDLDSLKRSISLPAVVGDRVPKIDRVGNEWVCCCPFHSEKTPSFKVFQKDGIWLAYCHGACQKTWNVFTFVQEFDGISFNQAVAVVEEYSSAKRTQGQTSWQEGKKRVENTFAQIHEKKDYKQFPLDRLKTAEDAVGNESSASWFAARGIGLDTARKFHCGYIQSAKSISQNHPLVHDGWIVFPTIEKGQITLLKYRSVKDKEILRAPGMATSLYNAEAIDPFDDLFVVEGEPDCLIMAQAGLSCVALPMAGFNPTPEMRDKMLSAQAVYLAGDMDTAGRAAMKKLWAELGERTYLIEWPEGCKDANDVFLKHCSGDVKLFQALVSDLKAAAKKQPIPDFFDLSESVRNADMTNPMDDPSRLHFPWRCVDEMAVCRPGSVVTSYATATGTGKTTFWMNVELFEAIQHNSVVINYSGELSPQEYAELVTANLIPTDRLALTPADFAKASLKLQNARFYVGYNPDVSSIREILGDDKTPGVLEWAIRRFGANIVVLDHLHFFTSGEKDPIQTEAWAMTRAKNLARRYNLIFIVIGQSRKAQASQTNKVSEQADAKGSESFSSTASTTYHLHRNARKDIDWDHPETWPKDRLDPQTDVRLYKCRNKGPGKAFARLWFDGATGRFSEITSREEI